MHTTCADIHGFEPYKESVGTSLLTDMTKTKLIGHMSQSPQPLAHKLVTDQEQSN